MLGLRSERLGGFWGLPCDRAPSPLHRVEVSRHTTPQGERPRVAVTRAAGSGAAAARPAGRPLACGGYCPRRRGPASASPPPPPQPVLQCCRASRFAVLSAPTRRWFLLLLLRASVGNNASPHPLLRAEMGPLVWFKARSLVPNIHSRLISESDLHPVVRGRARCSWRQGCARAGGPLGQGRTGAT